MLDRPSPGVLPGWKFKPPAHLAIPCTPARLPPERIRLAVSEAHEHVSLGDLDHLRLQDIPARLRLARGVVVLNHADLVAILDGGHRSALPGHGVVLGPGAPHMPALVCGAEAVEVAEGAVAQVA